MIGSEQSMFKKKVGFTKERKADKRMSKVATYGSVLKVH